MAIEGFEVPVHRALTQPVLIGGAPKGVCNIQSHHWSNLLILSGFATRNTSCIIAACGCCALSKAGPLLPRCF